MLLKALGNGTLLRWKPGYSGQDQGCSTLTFTSPSAQYVSAVMISVQLHKAALVMI